MLVSLNPEAHRALRHKKNLLAFSGGSDSSALFHLLVTHNTTFDIIHVNYGRRLQSDVEEQHAKTLAAQHQKKCYTRRISLDSANFEHRARTARYAFFHEIMLQYRYDNLITAHQLNDRFEWLLMQLCKGSGLYELVGMRTIEPRDDYTLIRPLLHVNSDAIQHYLKQHAIEYFIDESNTDTRFQRNAFRKHHATPLLQQYAGGIAKSFQYLDEDRAVITEKTKIVEVNQLSYFALPSHRRAALIAVDAVLKQHGCVVSQYERTILKSADTLVVARTYVVAMTRNYCFIAPYLRIPMSKAFKEQCRRLKIEPKLRPYLYSDPESFECVRSLLL